MGPEDIMLSEIGQTEKGKYYMISLVCGILKRKAKLIETESKMVITRGWGREGKLLRASAFHSAPEVTLSGGGPPCESGSNGFLLNTTITNGDLDHLLFICFCL